MKTRLILSILTLLSVSSAQANPSCLAKEYHSRVTVSQIIDGDTVKLESGQLVRLIGINTPEIDHQNESNSEPLAHQAKQKLSQLIGQKKQVNLVLDKELVDPYNRMLAHLFNLDGENIQQKLVEQGYADAYVYGENDLFWQCYYQAEISARKQNLGIWQYEQFQAKAVNRLYKSHAYAYEWQGKLNRTFEKNDTLWLVLDNKLYIGLQRQDQYRYFKTLDFDKLVGQTLYIKTPVYYQDKRWRGDLVKPWQLIIDTDIQATH